MKKFIFLEHTADIKFQAFGKNLKEVFTNSAKAMFNSMYSGKVKSKEKFIIKTKGDDLENLMYNFLEEFLFLIDSKNFFLSKIKIINLDEKKFELKAELVGDDVRKYNLNHDFKAVTYNDIFIKFDKKNKIWIAQVVMDI
jgi:SHS2 domain-containing protein